MDEFKNHIIRVTIELFKDKKMYKNNFIYFLCLRISFIISVANIFPVNMKRAFLLPELRRGAATIALAAETLEFVQYLRFNKTTRNVKNTLFVQVRRM